MCYHSRIFIRKFNKTEGVCGQIATQMKREAGENPARSRHRVSRAFLKNHWSSPGRGEKRSGVFCYIDQPGDLPVVVHGLAGSRGIDCTKIIGERHSPSLYFHV